MHGHTSFEINISGSENDVKEINNTIKVVITDEAFDEGAEIEIEETYKCVDIDEITELAINMAKAAPDSSFEMSGVIDTSESAGEFMDFAFAYKSGAITRQSSDWYMETCIEDYDSYEDFIDEWEDEVGDLSEERFEALKDKNEFVFFVETRDGIVIMSEVPLSHVDTIDC